MLWNGFPARDRLPAPPCGFAERFLLIAEVSIFSKITPETTPAQFAQALESLRQLKQELEAELRELGRFHFAAAAGRLHRCVSEVFEDLSFILKNWELLQPEPAPPPALKSVELTPEEVVNQLKDAILSSPPETYLGIEDQPPGTGSDR